MGTYISCNFTFVAKVGVTDEQVQRVVDETAKARDIVDLFRRGDGYYESDWDVREAQDHPDQLRVHYGYYGEAGYGTLNAIDTTMKIIADKLADWTCGPMLVSTHCEEDDIDYAETFYGPRDVALEAALSAAYARRDRLSEAIDRMQQLRRRPGKRIPYEIPEFRGDRDVNEGWTEAWAEKKD